VSDVLLVSGLLRVLESPFLQIFEAWKVLENRHGSWKSLNLCLKVLESAWIWFSKTPWPNQLVLKKVFQMASFWPQMCIKSIFGRWGSLWCLYNAYKKVSVWFNLVLLLYPSYGLWKSLNLILTNGQEPCSVLNSDCWLSDGSSAEEGGCENKQCNGTRGHRQIPTAACTHTASVQRQIRWCCFHRHSSGMSSSFLSQ